MEIHNKRDQFRLLAEMFPNNLFPLFHYGENQPVFFFFLKYYPIFYLISQGARQIGHPQILSKNK